jgi:hypothetical protein
MNSRARWAAGALDLTNDIETAATYLTIGQVSDATGLSQHTISDSLTRKEITNPETPRGALCRPAARVGDVPLWSQGQVDEFHRRQRIRDEKRSRGEELPTVSVQEARERGLVSTEEVAELFGQHDQTVRRWERYDAAYPRKVAKRAREGQSGPPEHVRELAAIRAWATERGYTEAVPIAS